MKKRFDLWLMWAALIALMAGVVWWTGGEEPVARSSEDLVWLRKETVAINTTATTGSGSTDRMVHGYVYAVHLDFGGSITTTTDITLSQTSPALTLLELTNYYTDTWYYPTVQQHDGTGSTVTAYAPVLAADQVDISVAQTTSGTQVLTATIFWGQ